jgi:hypothetical protein
MLFRALICEPEGFQFAGIGAENGASVCSDRRLRASVWRMKGLRMELGVDFKHQKRFINTPENRCQIILACFPGVSVCRKRG